jgi:hypothetical protein
MPPEISTPLFEAVLRDGIPYASHATDLYLPDSPQVRTLLGNYPTSQKNARRFVNQVEGGIWIDVPFAYLPAWEAKYPKTSKL